MNPEHTQKRRKIDAHTHTTHSDGTTTRSSGRTAVSPVQEKKQRLEQRLPRAHMHTLTSSSIAHRPHDNRHHRRTNHSAPAQHMLPCYLEECIYICVTSAHAAKQTRIHSLHPTRYPFGSECTPSAHPIRRAGAVHRSFLAEKLALQAVVCAKESSR